MSSDIDHAARDRRGAPLHDILLATFDKTDDLHRAAALRALQRKESRVRGSENTFGFWPTADHFSLRPTLPGRDSPGPPSRKSRRREAVRNEVVDMDGASFPTPHRWLIVIAGPRRKGMSFAPGAT